MHLQQRQLQHLFLLQVLRWLTLVIGLGHAFRIAKYKLLPVLQALLQSQRKQPTGSHC